jgi:Dolichyl-phosphate-mannose-protein mannosyltransferase
VTADIDSRKPRPALLFALFYLLLLAVHAPLLRLPYFWDEAGYYIPAARDLLLTGALIPHSTLSNAHPPLVLAYVALAWKIFGYSPLVTRVTMLSVAAFSLLGFFRLAQRVANTEIAIASTLCTALYPVFFAQSSLAQVDLAAAGLIFWALLAYVEHRPWTTAFWFSAAVTAKETAIVAPLALFVWGLARCASRLSTPASRDVVSPEPGAEQPENKAHGASRGSESEARPAPQERKSVRQIAKENLALLFPILPLTLWFTCHYLRTGFVFGNPEFFRYNVQATLHPLRIVLATGLRLWHVFGYLNIFVLTLAAGFAMLLPPLKDRNDDQNQERPRIALPIQFSFAAVILAYILAMAVIGGAELARYMLPAVPLLIILCVSTLWRRVVYWRLVTAVVVLSFVAALFVNPPYGFSLEDNLAYRDYILLHQRAEQFIAARYPSARVLTAWPASDELTGTYLGYVTQPVRVVRIENFTAENLFAAAEMPTSYQIALVFSTKYEPRHRWFGRSALWQKWKMEYFGYHRDVPPAAAAQILGGQLVYEQQVRGQWVGVIEIEREEEARGIPDTKMPGILANSGQSRFSARPLERSQLASPSGLW